MILIMRKIVRRPRFRGGPVSSYGNGIATGLADGGRVVYNVVVPIFPAGYSAVPDGGITGADIKKMAEKNPTLLKMRDQFGLEIDF